MIKILIPIFLFLFLTLSVSACSQTTRTPISESLTRPCADWPSADGRNLETTRDLLGLAQEGRVAHADCQARYDALRGVVSP